MSNRRCRHMCRQHERGAMAVISNYNVSPQQCRPDRPLIVRSPIAGTVVKADIVTGQYVKADDEAPVTVANIDKVWVVASVKEKDMHYLDGVEQAEIRLVACPDTVFRGRVRNVAQVLNEQTQSVEVTVECDNAGAKMKPAMYGDMLLCDHERRCVRVPSSALMQGSDSSYVLMDCGRGEYVRRNVTVGRTAGGRTEIRSGLRCGERVVTEGAFLIDTDR